MIFVACLHHPCPEFASTCVTNILLPHQMMFGTLFGLFSILIIKVFSATGNQLFQGSIALAEPSAGQSQPLILANASSNGTASANDLAITCDHKLGQNLRVTSCKSIFPLLRSGTEQYVFADRTNSPSLRYDVGLPYRVQGRKLHECQTTC